MTDVISQMMQHNYDLIFAIITHENNGYVINIQDNFSIIDFTCHG